MLSLHAAERGQ